MRHSMLNKTLLALALATSLATTASAQSAFGDLSGSGQVGYESQYVFRGKKITNSAIQPKAEIGLQTGPNGNLYLGGWSNQPVSRRSNSTGAGGPDQADEIDLFAGYIYSLPGLPLKVDFGDIYYWYPEAGNTPIYGLPGSTRTDRTDEGYIGFSWDTTNTLPSIFQGRNFNPSVYYYHDYILDSNTVEISITTVWDLTPIVGFSGLTLTPTALAGWTHANRSFGDDFTTGIAGNPHGNWSNGYLYWKGGVELDYNISPNCYLYGDLNYEGNSDKKVGGYAGSNPQLGGTPSNVWFGAGLKFRR